MITIESLRSTATERSVDLLFTVNVFASPAKLYAMVTLPFSNASNVIVRDGMAKLAPILMSLVISIQLAPPEIGVSLSPVKPLAVPPV